VDNDSAHGYIQAATFIAEHSHSEKCTVQLRQTVGSLYAFSWYYCTPHSTHVHSADWCLRLALRTHSGACQKRTNEHSTLQLSVSKSGTSLSAFCQCLRTSLIQAFGSWRLA